MAKGVCNGTSLIYNFEVPDSISLSVDEAVSISSIIRKYPRLQNDGRVNLVEIQLIIRASFIIIRMPSNSQLNREGFNFTRTPVRLNFEKWFLKNQQDGSFSRTKSLKG